jgi:hypothetical protein
MSFGFVCARSYSAVTGGGGAPAAHAETSKSVEPNMSRYIISMCSIAFALRAKSSSAAF